MTALLKGRIDHWIDRRHPPERGAVHLLRQRLYILPTNYGYTFAAMLFVIFLWATNYTNSMGFVLTFLLAAVALNSMWRCNTNLLHLRLQPGPVEPVFAGQTARFIFRLDAPDGQVRYGVGLQWQDEEPVFADIPAQGSEIAVTLPAERRGWLTPGRLRVVTRFPLGLFQAWSWVRFEHRCLVYPRPHGSQPLPTATAVNLGTGAVTTGAGMDDFSDLRGYRPGDSPRHIAWKAAARSDELRVKRFTGQTHPELWLDWHSVSSGSIEERLSQLTQWLLTADHHGQAYGLRLPGIELAPGRGPSHRRRCLETLALFQLEHHA